MFLFIQRLVIMLGPPAMLITYFYEIGFERALTSIRSARPEVHALYACIVLFVLAYAFMVLDNAVTLGKRITLLESINKKLASKDEVPEEGSSQAQG